MKKRIALLLALVMAFCYIGGGYSETDVTPEEQDEWIWPEPEPAPEELQESEEDMAALGASEFRANGTDYTINDPNIANEFVPGDYAAGANVYYQGTLYRFNTNHSGAWTGTDVSVVKLGAEVTDLKSALDVVRVALSDTEASMNVEAGSVGYRISGNSWIGAEGYTLSNLTTVESGQTYFVKDISSLSDFAAMAFDNAAFQNPVALTGTSFTIPEGKTAFLCSYLSAYFDIDNPIVLECLTARDDMARAEIQDISSEEYTLAIMGSENNRVSGNSMISATGYNLSQAASVKEGTTYFVDVDSPDDFGAIAFNDAGFGGPVPMTGTRFKIPEGKSILICSYLATGFNANNPMQLKYLTANDEIARENARTKIHIGTGQQYTTLKAGLAAAYAKGNVDVIVHPGTYNLISEFATEIAAATGDVGIPLGNNIHVFFCDGSKVNAKFSNSQSTYSATVWRWIYDHFQPFYAGNGDYTLENLDIEAWDTRYCVHDELGGYGTATHKYINCRMKYKNTHSTDINYVQCIGGGLGQHCTIVIDGGYYESETDYGYGTTPAEDCQQPISYHNGPTSGCDSSITIKDVYLANYGRFRFGYYGSSTIKSQIMICGCSMGKSTVKSAESSFYTIDNFNVTEWNCTVRN